MDVPSHGEDVTQWIAAVWADNNTIRQMAAVLVRSGMNLDALSTMIVGFDFVRRVSIEPFKVERVLNDDETGAVVAGLLMVMRRELLREFIRAVALVDLMYCTRNLFFAPDKAKRIPLFVEQYNVYVAEVIARLELIETDGRVSLLELISAIDWSMVTLDTIDVLLSLKIHIPLVLTTEALVRLVIEAHAHGRGHDIVKMICEYYFFHAVGNPDEYCARVAIVNLSNSKVMSVPRAIMRSRLRIRHHTLGAARIASWISYKDGLCIHAVPTTAREGLKLIIACSPPVTTSCKTLLVHRMRYQLAGDVFTTCTISTRVVMLSVPLFEDSDAGRLAMDALADGEQWITWATHPLDGAVAFDEGPENCHATLIRFEFSGPREDAPGGVVMIRDLNIMCDEPVCGV